MVELLTWKELDEKFPLKEKELKFPKDMWGHLLKRFRDEGRLLPRQGPDCKRWHYRLLPGRTRHVMAYKLEAVVLCICRDAQSLHPRPSTTYLCDLYYNEFCEILQEAKAQRVLKESGEKEAIKQEV